MRCLQLLYLTDSIISAIALANPLVNTVGRDYKTAVINPYTNSIRLVYSVEGTSNKRALLIAIKFIDYNCQ
jgi:hypothetical protein